jgi:hypothetical protein
MLPRKFRQRFEALLDDNQVLSEDAVVFAESAKELQQEAHEFSEDLIAQEQYFFELTEDPGIDPVLIEPLEQQLLDLAMNFSGLAKEISETIDKASDIVMRIIDNLCLLSQDRRRLESRGLKSFEREELLCKMEADLTRLKRMYYRCKLEVLQQQEAFGRMKLLGQVGVN